MEETGNPKPLFNKWPEPQTFRVPVEGGVLHGLDWGGHGNPAHLLHANGFCAGTYTPFVRHLLDSFRVLASDIRGHGGSDPIAPARIRHWRVFAEDLRSLVASRMNPPVVGMGHSLGAVTTLIAAAAYPHLFSALVLIEPVLPPRRLLLIMAALRIVGLAGWMPLAKRARRRKRTFRSRAEAFRRFASGRGLFKTWSPEFIDAYLSCGLLEKDDETAVLRCDPETEARIFESVPSDVWRTVEQVRCPMLAIRGEHSKAFRQEAAERLRRLATHGQYRTIAASGHFIPMERPEACAAAIVEWMEQNRRQKPKKEMEK
jgi:pimeloyl-ACP methyl ester carboxylesterase